MSSADAKVGDRADFEVLEDVSVGGPTVIAKGDTALGTVTVAEAKRRMGRAGKLDINVDIQIAITTATKVVARGAGTIARKNAEAGRPTLVTGLVGAGDRVAVVYYQDGAAANQAKEIQVLAKAGT